MVGGCLLSFSAGLVEAYQEAKTIGIPKAEVAQAVRIGSIIAHPDLADEFVHRW